MTKLTREEIYKAWDTARRAHWPAYMPYLKVAVLRPLDVDLSFESAIANGDGIFPVATFARRKEWSEGGRTIRELVECEGLVVSEYIRAYNA